MANKTSITDILTERQRQNDKWGEQNHHPMKWLAILTEEHGEVAKAILEDDESGYRNELIHVAAVAVAAIEAYDRSTKENKDVK